MNHLERICRELPDLPYPSRTQYGPDRTVVRHFYTADQMRKYAAQCVEAELLKRIEADRWIPCSERLPSNSEPVLVYGEDGVQVGERLQTEGGGHWLVGDFVWPFVIHCWRPLPPPPTDQEPSHE